MIDKSLVKYIVETNGEDYSLLLRLLSGKVEIHENLMGDSFYASENNTNLVGCFYTKIDNEWYCFYEPTAVKVDWNDVDIGIKSKFPHAEKIKPTMIAVKFHQESN